MTYLYLLLSILFSGSLLLFFKWIERFNFQLLPIIVVNYFTCVICGAFLEPNFFQQVTGAEGNVLPLAIGMGILFISIFFLIGKVTQAMGVGYTSLVQKMSMLITVVFSFLYFHEGVTWQKILGILLAIGATILMQSGKVSGEQKPSGGILLSAALVFVGSGVIDSLLKVYDVHYAAAVPSSSFLIFLFGTAGILGLPMALYPIFTGKMSFNLKEWGAGILLGVPNFFSLFFLLKALNNMDATTFFPVNNIGILLFSCLIGFFMFKEKFNTWNYAGIGAAVLAIVLLI